MPSVAMDHLPHYDCGVVLTGSAGRIREGFEVLALKKVDKLVVSGVYKDTKLHQIFPLLPYYPEIKSDDIILEKISGSTYGNAVQSLQVVETLKCRNILLITSHLHMYRAYRTFREHFPNEVQISPYVTVSHTQDSSAVDILTEAFKSLCYPVITLIPWLFFS